MMSAEEIAFVAFGILTLGGGLGVVSTRNMVHAALFLIVSLFGVAGFFVMLEAPFLAAVQVLVYIGAIAVIMLFAIMMTRGIGQPTSQRNSQWVSALIVAIVLLVTLGITLLTQFDGVEVLQADAEVATVEQLGIALVSPQAFVLPFEVASILLLAALVGAVAIARE